MEGSCEYTEQAVADSRQGVVLKLGANNSSQSKNIKLVMKCHKDDEANAEEFGRAYSTNGKKRNAYRILVRKPERKKPL
jgi:hypothetical protein